MEVIIIDDHSVDATTSIVAALAENDDRIRFLPAEEHGGANARNQGARLARGRYLIFADADDIVPDGAYSLLVAELDRSGSDMAVGNALKFSPRKTWEPDLPWGTFSMPARAIQLRDRPALLHSRTCWNKMFRRHFWASAGIAFPHAERSNDIAPMVHAYTAARSIDVLTDIVYVYRQRPGTASMTARAHRPRSVASYLGQEAHCAELVRAYGDPGCLDEFYLMFLTADGWAHLSRYLAEGPNADAAELSQAYPLVRSLVRNAPEHIWVGLSSEQRRAFTLFGEGVPILLSYIATNPDGQGGAGTGTHTDDVASCNEARLHTAAAAASDALATHRGAGHPDAQQLQLDLLRALVHCAEELDDALLRALMTLVAGVAPDGHGSDDDDTLVLSPAEARLLAACRRGSPAELRWLLAMGQGVQLGARVAEATGERLGIDVTLTGVTRASECVLRLHGRREGGVVSTAAHTVAASSEPAVIRFILDRELLTGPDVWDGVVVLASGGAAIELPLTAAGTHPQMPSGRAARLVALRARHPGNPFEVELRPGVLSRAARKALSLIGTSK